MFSYASGHRFQCGYCKEAFDTAEDHDLHVQSKCVRMYNIPYLKYHDIPMGVGGLLMTQGQLQAIQNAAAKSHARNTGESHSDQYRGMNRKPRPDEVATRVQESKDNVQEGLQVPSSPLRHQAASITTQAQNSPGRTAKPHRKTELDKRISQWRNDIPDGPPGGPSLTNPSPEPSSPSSIEQHDGQASSN